MLSRSYHVLLHLFCILDVKDPSHVHFYLFVLTLLIFALCFLVGIFVDCFRYLCLSFVSFIINKSIFLYRVKKYITLGDNFHGKGTDKLNYK